MGGEGLLGLTRAIHYAGARSVLATLWAVSDKSTPLLMKRFYGYLKAGKSRDEALRGAQIDLIRAARSTTDAVDLSHPFRWAAFQLSGDCR
jgi:CHAT domain-containing protein